MATHHEIRMRKARERDPAQRQYTDANWYPGKYDADYEALALEKFRNQPIRPDRAIAMSIATTISAVAITAILNRKKLASLICGR